MKILSYPSVLTFVLGAQKNRLIEKVLFEYPQHMFSISEGSVFQIIYRSQQLLLFLCGVGKFKFSLCTNIVLLFFHILFLQEYWVPTENRIPLKPVLVDLRIVALSISSHEQTNKTESAVF